MNGSWQHTTSRLLRHAALLALPLFSSSVTANDIFGEKFSLGVGVYFMDSDTLVRADSIRSTRVGSTVAIEDTLGLGRERLFRADATWRFLPRHQLRLGYFGSDRRAQTVIDSEIVFNGTVFPLQSVITTDFDFEIVQLAYELRVDHGGRYELGASAGVHHVRFGLAMDARLSGAGPIAEVTVRESVRADAPLPMIGLRGMLRIAPELYLQAHAQYFELALAGTVGNIQDYQLGLLWQASRHVGIGTGYNLFAIRSEVNKGRHFRGAMDWKYRGAQLFLRASF